MSPQAYESLNSVEAIVDGARHSGTYRVMTGSVIVYYEGEVKFASVGMDRPELVAKWLLTDLVQRAESGTRKRPLD
ncbi:MULTISPECIES: hypothetical protein [Paraburkholderia]|uniref:hypothetical protein n=1 Tax=Paraburkholderia TaxID=1822464 RepID=UPI00159262FB|nr:hypothetical protein [Paraburkholderia youngii]NUX55722.1 hypothetical protein [Paraburkholderia youngii]